MEPWIAAKLDYAAQLRSADKTDHAPLYAKAYETVSRLRWEKLGAIDDPAARTAGTGPHLAAGIARICQRSDKVIELGCGRGYTAMVVASRVARLRWASN